MDSTARSEPTRGLHLAEAIRSAREQHRAGAGAVVDVLLRTPGLDAAVLQQLLPQQAGVGVLFVAGAAQPDFEKLERNTARQWRCVLLRTGIELLLAAEDPWDEALLQRVARLVGEQPTPVAVTRALLLAVLGDAGPTLQEPGVANDRVSAAGPIVSFVDQALHAGFEAGASDVHFECDRTGVSAKHRLDGVMASFSRLPGLQQSQEVISRIKVLAQLDITERRLPQDGRFRFDFGGVQIDLRVSIMPSVHGEDAVLRLLDKAQLRTPSSAVSFATWLACPVACSWSRAQRAVGRPPLFTPRFPRSTPAWKRSSRSRTRLSTNCRAFFRFLSMSAKG
jgi:general secretion pathway protein E